MLSSVVDQCISMALTSAGRRMSLVGGRGLARRPAWQSPLAAYPRLVAVLEKAEADGIIGRRSTRLH